LPGIAGVWLKDTWLWREPIKLGDSISGTARIASLDEKETSYAGNAIEQITQTDYVNQEDRPIATVWSNVIRFERSAARERSKYLDSIQAPYKYTDEEIQAIEQAYLQEGDKRRGATPRYWEDTSIGEHLHEIVKGPLSLTSMIGWVLGWGSPLYLTNRLLFRHLAVEPGGGLTNEWNCPDTLEGTHWDLDLARASGMPLPYDFAPMRVAWAAHLLTDWMGDDAFLKRLSVRLRRPNLLGDTTWITGRVVDHLVEDDGEAVVAVEVSGRNQRDEQSIVASATVKLPRKESSG
jgi:acyl dehydratase